MPDPRRIGTVFLDRDGVLNAKAPEGDYVKRWSEFAFLPGALEGLRLLTSAGLKVVVVTNQRGIARGRMTQADLDEIHARMMAQVAAAGGRVDAVYACPHEGGCECRKPRPGLLLRAARDHADVVLAESALIGDRAHDMQAAEAVGALRVYIKGFDEPLPPVDHVAAGLLDAARWVVAVAQPADPAAAGR